MKKILFFILIFINGQIKAQFNIQDSLALVDFYYATNGSSWYNDSNWLVTPVRRWKHLGFAPNDSTRVKGIFLTSNNLTGYLPLSIGNMTELHSLNLIDNNITGNIPYTIGRLKKVIALTLANNNFAGQITDSIGQMTALQGLNLYNNNFTGYIPASLASLPDFYGLLIFDNQFDVLPDFSGLQWSGIADIRVQNNLFTFEDLEPNMTVASFACSICDVNYSPQRDSINMAIDTTVQLGSAFTMRCTIGGTQNIYQWNKNGVNVPNATDSVLTFNNISFADSGVYSCKVTNSAVTGLAFYRRTVKVHVVESTGNMDDIKQAEGFNVYPNPAVNMLYIECGVKNSQILISDILGDIKIKQQTNSNYTHIDISGLERGVYFIKVVSEAMPAGSRVPANMQGIAVKKFVKE